MRKNYYLLMVSLLIASCGGADTSNENSNLNGKWASSTCFQINPDPFNDEYKSLKMIMELNNGEITNKLHQYTDTECKIFSRETNNGLFAGLYGKYNVGQTVTLERGDIAKEVDFIDKNGNLYPDIYLFEGTEPALYFGNKDMVLVDPCPLMEDNSQYQYSTEGDIIFEGDSFCWIWTDRPTSINYKEPYTKLSE